MKSIKIQIPIILLFLLPLLLVADLIITYYSSNSRHFKHSVSVLKKYNDSLNNELRNSYIIPLLEFKDFYASNSVVVASNINSVLSRRFGLSVSDFSSSYSTNTNSSERSSVFYLPNVHFFSVSGCPMFSTGLFTYRLGDLYLGSPIVFIDSSFALLQNGICIKKGSVNVN